MNNLETYEILGTIGEGTFGVVKLGKIKETGEKVAIKILEKKRIVTKEESERVKREIEVVGKINHLNVINIKKIFEDTEKIYLIMEFCEKGDLYNYIVKKDKLDEIEAAYFYYQLINGLESLHLKGIVHRDLKPENLLLNNENIIKIIDFGLCNYFNKTIFLKTPCGSPSYASPEMVSGKDYDGFLIDIWSTGIILYAMLCGFLPFEEQNNDILFKKIIKCEVKYPDFLSSDSLDLLKKILVKNPKERINIYDIKKHRFYLKGKNKFKLLHPKFAKDIEKIENEINKKRFYFIKEINLAKSENTLINKENKKLDEEEKVNIKKEEREIIFRKKSNKDNKINQIKNIKNNNNIDEEDIKINITFYKNYKDYNELKNNLNEKNNKNNRKLYKNIVINNGKELKSINMDNYNKLIDKKHVINSDKKEDYKRSIINQKRNIYNYLNNYQKDDKESIKKNIKSANIDIQTINRKRENIIKKENEENKSPEFKRKSILRKNNKSNINIEYKKINDIIKNEMKDIKFRNSELRERNTTGYFEKNSLNLNSGKNEKDKIINKNNKVNIENNVLNFEKIENNKILNKTNTSLKDKVGNDNMNLTNKITINFRNNNTISNPSISNIDNLKNRTNLYKDISKDKKKETLKQNVHNKIELIMNKRNEIIRERTPSVKQSKHINNRYINSPNRSRLNEIDNQFDIDNARSCKNKPVFFINSFINNNSEYKDIKESEKKDSHINYLKNKENRKKLEANKIIFDKDFYNKKANLYSSNVIDITNKLNTEIISNLKQKMNNNYQNSIIINNLNSTNIIRDNKSKKDNERNNTQIIKNENNRKIIDSNTKQFSLKNKRLVNFKPDNSNSNKEYNNKTYKNIVINTIDSNNNTTINTNQNLNNIQIKNNKLNNDNSYKRRQIKKIDSFQYFDSKININRKSKISDKKNHHLNLHKINEENSSKEKNINSERNKKIIINSNRKENKKLYKNNITNFLYSNSYRKRKEVYNQKLYINKEMKSPKNNIKINEIKNNDKDNEPRRNHRFYISSNKEDKEKGRSLNYISNDLKSPRKKEIIKLSPLRLSKNVGHYKNNIKSSSLNGSSKKRIYSELSYSKENYNNPETKTLNNRISSSNYFSYNLYKNSYKKNNITPRRNNSSFINNSSYEINKEKRNVFNMYNTNDKKNINEKYIIPKFINKGLIIHEIDNSSSPNHIKDSAVDKSLERINNLNSINKTKPNYKCITSYYLTSNNNSKTNTIDRSKYNQLYKLSTNAKNSYKKIKINRVEREDRNKMEKIKSLNNSFKKIDTKRIENNLRKKKIEYTSNTNNIQDKKKKIFMNDYTNNFFNDYNYNNSIALNNNKNQLANTSYKNNNANKFMIKINKENIDDILIKLTKSKNDYIKQEKNENNSFNNSNIKFENQNIPKMKQRKTIKPFSLLKKSLNKEISDPFLMFNTNNESKNNMNYASRLITKDSLKESLNISKNNIVIHKRTETINNINNNDIFGQNNENFKKRAIKYYLKDFEHKQKNVK